jgi:hypothetical protein
MSSSLLPWTAFISSLPFVSRLQQAVSVLDHGITVKQDRWRNSASPWLIAIEDPQARA